jgi:hypothetical protein
MPSNRLNDDILREGRLCSADRDYDLPENASRVEKLHCGSAVGEGERSTQMRSQTSLDQSTEGVRVSW